MKIKLFENFNNIIITTGKLDISNLKLIKTISYLDKDNYAVDRLNKYLSRYYIRNNRYKGYYDIIITDNELNILFGESREDGKFKYQLTFDSKYYCHIFKDNSNSKFGLVDETGKNILVNAEYDYINNMDHFWKMTTGKEPILKPFEMAIANENGVILMKKNSFFSNISKSSIFDNGKWTKVIKYKIKGEDSYRTSPVDYFFNTDWEIKLSSDKYNL